MCLIHIGINITYLFAYIYTLVEVGRLCTFTAQNLYFFHNKTLFAACFMGNLDINHLL